MFSSLYAPRWMVIGTLIFGALVLTPVALVFFTTGHLEWAGLLTAILPFAIVKSGDVLVKSGDVLHDCLARVFAWVITKLLLIAIIGLAIAFAAAVVFMWGYSIWMVLTVLSGPWAMMFVFFWVLVMAWPSNAKRSGTN